MNLLTNMLSCKFSSNKLSTFFLRMEKVFKLSKIERGTFYYTENVSSVKKLY